MTGVLLATITHDDSIWTVSLHMASSPGSEMVLLYVRDWINGGDERVTIPVAPDLAELLLRGPSGEVPCRLLEELRNAREEACSLDLRH